MSIEQAQFPRNRDITLLGFDIEGVNARTGEPIPTRTTGIVTLTQNFITGLDQMSDVNRLIVTRNVVHGDPKEYSAVTPDGIPMEVQEIETGFPHLYMTDGRPDKEKINGFLEERVWEPDNPVYQDLAQQYANLIKNTGNTTLVVETTNALVSILKMEQQELFDPFIFKQFNITATIHDIDGYEERLRFIAQSMQQSGMNIKLIAGSEYIYQQLVEFFPDSLDRVFKVNHGFDIHEFDRKLEKARANNTFEGIRSRNNLPHKGRMILMSARRVDHKRHEDVIRAMHILKDRGELKDAYVAFSGSAMNVLNSRAYDDQLRALVTELGLNDRVFFLDELNGDEIAACYDAATISVLPSSIPEGFGYSNIESMLAGTPVITTKMGGPLDYIDETPGQETGLFVKPKDPKGLAEAISRSLLDRELYERMKRNARKKAEDFSLEAMGGRYINVINLGADQQPLYIHARRRFSQLGSGWHTNVYAYTEYRGEAESGFVLQDFQYDLTQEQLDQLRFDWVYLKRAYAAMSGLLPNQRIRARATSNDTYKAYVVKEQVASEKGRRTFLELSPDDLQHHTLKQLAQFITLTKSFLLAEPATEQDVSSGYRIPDLIDADFENLIVDRRGNLKLMDTNNLINVGYLRRLINPEQRISLVRNIHKSDTFRRIMFLERKFFGKTLEEIQADPFYANYIESEEIATLYDNPTVVGAHQKKK